MEKPTRLPTAQSQRAQQHAASIPSIHILYCYNYDHTFLIVDMVSPTPKRILDRRCKDGSCRSFPLSPGRK